MKTTPNPAGGTSPEVIACSLKMLPEDQWIPASETAIRINPGNKAHLHQFRQALGDTVIQPAHLALLTAKRWPSTGVSLTVSFLEAIDPALATRLLSHMNSWSQYCNAKFTQVTSNGQVRISLVGSGYWSYLGTDILHIAAGQATMNLQGFSMSTPESEYHRVVRHETGHTLGFPHEHTRSEIVNRIDPAKAKAYFLANDGWDANMVTAQVLTPLNDSALIETAHADPNSIMCYWLPASIMKDNIAVAGGTDIDAQDQQFAAQVYPLAHKIIVKEHKDVKLEKVEIKEKNEKIEHKEKLEKVEHKEKLEKIEHKEKNEIIDHKIIDHKVTDILHPTHPVIVGAAPGQAPSGLEQRVQELEAVVTSLTSFIDSSLRPNLSKGALSNE
jgi:peptidyl-tRNA hydrolase